MIRWGNFRETSCNVGMIFRNLPCVDTRSQVKTRFSVQLRSNQWNAAVQSWFSLITKCTSTSFTFLSNMFIQTLKIIHKSWNCGQCNRWNLTVISVFDHIQFVILCFTWGEWCECLSWTGPRTNQPARAGRVKWNAVLAEPFPAPEECWKGMFGSRSSSTRLGTKQFVKELKMEVDDEWHLY